MVVIVSASVAVGVVGYMAYEEIITYDKLIDGLYFPDNTTTHSEVILSAYDYEREGKWVCINIRDMTFQAAVDTCTHEAAHEMFAGIIEKNPDKINQVMEIIQNDS